MTRPGATSLPNVLTYARILAVPAVVGCLYVSPDVNGRWWALAVYLVACFMMYSIVLATLALAGAPSRRCIDEVNCSAGEFAILIPLWVIWGGIGIWAALWGWQGLLWGARVQW